MRVLLRRLRRSRVDMVVDVECSRKPRRRRWSTILWWAIARSQDSSGWSRPRCPASDAWPAGHPARYPRYRRCRVPADRQAPSDNAPSQSEKMGAATDRPRRPAAGRPHQRGEILELGKEYGLSHSVRRQSITHHFCRPSSRSSDHGEKPLRSNHACVTEKISSRRNVGLFLANVLKRARCSQPPGGSSCTSALLDCRCIFAAARSSPPPTPKA